jgi:hypothetical protein
VIELSPPLIIDEVEIEQGIETLAAVLTGAARGRYDQGLDGPVMDA